MIRPILILILISFTALAHAQPVDWHDRVVKLESAKGAALDDLKKELIAGGMPAHKALKDGPASTAALRSELRRSIRAQRDAASRTKGLLMHEWGAISYAQGIDLAKADTHRDDNSDLPQFVQVWSKIAEQAVRDIPQPGIMIIRKPIVYFYTDKPQTMTFSVACPHGMFTQWFPKASTVNPDPAAGGPMPVNDALSGSTGLLVWKNFDLVPGPGAALPPVPENAWWWPICRDTDSTPINANGVIEKFLFYRGMLADVPAVLKVDGGAQKKYTLTNTRKDEAIQHVFVVNIEGGKAIAKYIPSLRAGEKVAVDLQMTADAKPIAEFATDLRQKLNESLEEAGLFPKEAAGMTQIWRRDWFETEGVRVIYLNPPAATASLMPIRIDPAPIESVRTYLISVECLKDSIENLIKQLIEKLSDEKYAIRDAAQKQLLQLGKQVEPALREALKHSDDEEVRTRITIILQRLDPNP